MTSEWSLFRVNSATEFSLTKKMENDIPEESHLSVPEIIKLHGYSCLELKVTTTDGFQLSVFRVEKPDIIPNGPAVLLQHGLLADAANWISIRVPNINLMNVPNTINVVITWNVLLFISKMENKTRLPLCLSKLDSMCIWQIQGGIDIQGST